jgi:hypothetical protein
LPLFANKAHSFPPIIIALAIASLVARKIAAANSGDGGLSSLAAADHDLINLALAKLDRIDTLLADIYKSLAELPDEIDEILTRHETRALQADFEAVVLGYNQLFQFKDPSDSDSQWLKRRLTQTKIQNLYARLTQSRQTASVTNLLDPNTALLVGQLAMVENGLLNLAGESPFEIKATLRDVYLSWLDRIEDPSIVGSTADYTLSAARRHSDLSLKASQSGIGQGLGFPFNAKQPEIGRPFNGETRSSFFTCAGVNDVTPGVAGFCNSDGPHGGHPGPVLHILKDDGKEITPDEYG